MRKKCIQSILTTLGTRCARMWVSSSTKRHISDLLFSPYSLRCNDECTHTTIPPACYRELFSLPPHGAACLHWILFHCTSTWCILCRSRVCHCGGVYAHGRVSHPARYHA